MKVAVNWESGMKFMGKGPSGISLPMDAGVSHGGGDSGVRPMEMIALGLIGCQAMDVISILLKKREEVTGFEVRFDGPRSSEYPQVFTSADIVFIVTGKAVSESAVLRSIELSATKYCPAYAMLEPAFPMELRYEIYETGNTDLIYGGVWKRTNGM